MTSTLIYYKVIESDSIPSLERDVSDMLHDGYDLAGGVSSYAFRDHLEDLHVYYCQALIKREAAPE